MKSLVPLAKSLADLAGSADGALDLAVQITKEGTDALGPFDDGRTVYLKEELRRCDVVTPDGRPDQTGAAHLVLVTEMLGQILPTVKPLPVAGRMVFTSPDEVHEIPAEHRLDLLVADIIRRADTSVHIGSAYWNDEGVDALLDVLAPAVRVRGVRVRIYAQDDKDNLLVRLRAGAVDLLDADTVHVFRYEGPPNSLMHAKFVVADSIRGYLGTANLTSLGFHHHIEVGVELTATQSQELVDFLDQLTSLDLFVSQDDCSDSGLRPQFQA
jgi:phosphatidylserine/phosphatidylglycerophosphate/cardiolipin synthase-like enzyme